jgi:hypothetical protein
MWKSLSTCNYELFILTPASETVQPSFGNNITIHTHFLSSWNNVPGFPVMDPWLDPQTA